MVFKDVFMIFLLVSFVIAVPAALFRFELFGYNLIPYMLSLALLIPLPALTRRSSRVAAEASALRAPPKAALLDSLKLYGAAMLVRIPLVLALGMAYEKTPLIYLVALTVAACEGGKLEDYGLRRDRIHAAILLGLLLYLAVVLPSVLIPELASRLLANSALLLGIDAPETLFLLPFMTICVGVSEELLFRGYIQTKLTSAAGFKSANLVQAVLFGVWHFVWHVSPLNLGAMVAHVLGTFAIGLAFGYAYHKLGNLVPLIVVHGLIDAVSVDFNPNAARIVAEQAPWVFFIASLLSLATVVLLARVASKSRSFSWLG